MTILAATKPADAVTTACVFDRVSMGCLEHGGYYTGDPFCLRRPRGDKLEARIARRKAKGKSTARLQVKRDEMRLVWS